MNGIIVIRAIAAIFLLIPSVQLDSMAQEADSMNNSLNPHLEVFRPYIGKTFRGEFKESTPEKPLFDISRWERALNGQAVRVLHSVNDGHYGGESIMMWDAKQNNLVSFYFTTAGFFTQSIISVENNRFTAHEKVTGEGSGITEVKSVTELLPGTGFHVKSHYLKNGEWIDGHEIRYVEYPEGKVNFK